MASGTTRVMTSQNHDPLSHTSAEGISSSAAPWYLPRPPAQPRSLPHLVALPHMPPVIRSCSWRHDATFVSRGALVIPLGMRITMGRLQGRYNDIQSLLGFLILSCSRDASTGTYPLPAANGLPYKVTTYFTFTTRTPNHPNHLSFGAEGWHRPPLIYRLAFFFCLQGYFGVSLFYK